MCTDIVFYFLQVQWRICSTAYTNRHTSPTLLLTLPRSDPLESIRLLHVLQRYSFVWVLYLLYFLIEKAFKETRYVLSMRILKCDGIRCTKYPVLAGDSNTYVFIFTVSFCMRKFYSYLSSMFKNAIF